MVRELDRRRQDMARRLEVIGITRKRLAELAAVDQSCLGRFLNGYSTATWSTVEKIEKALAGEERRALPRLAKQQRELEARIKRSEVCA